MIVCKLFWLSPDLQNADSMQMVVRIHVHAGVSAPTYLLVSTRHIIFFNVSSNKKHLLKLKNNFKIEGNPYNLIIPN